MKSIHVLILAGLLIPMATMPMQQSRNTAKKSQSAKKNVKSAKKSESECSDRKKSKNKFLSQLIKAQLFLSYLIFAGALAGEIYSYARPHSSVAKLGKESVFSNIMVTSSLCGCINTLAWSFDFLTR